MAFSLSVKGFVIIILSVFGLVASVILAFHFSEMKDVVSYFPIPSRAIAVETFPSASQEGTLFSISVRYPFEREQQDLRLILESEGYSDSVELYDDGKHEDGKVGDGIYGGFFDSTGKPTGEYIFKQESGESSEESLGGFVVYEPGCELIEGNGEIRFVILPYGYDDLLEFKKDAKKLLLGKDSLLQIEPFKSKNEKFSFSIVNTDRDLECEIGCQGVPTLVCCNNQKVYEEVSRCDYDSIFILVNSKKLCGSASSYAKVCADHDLSSLALVHELGHSFGDLADEYVYAESWDYDIGEIDNVNCNADCSAWEDITQECYEGCTYSNLYRSSETSIMRDYVPYFNPVCENHIEELIENYDLQGSETEKSLPRKSYFVNLRFGEEKEGKIEIGKIALKPISAGVNLRKTDYRIKLLAEGREIFETNLYVPNKLYPLPNVSSDAVFLDDFEFDVLLPFFPSEEIVIYKDGDVVDSKNVPVFSDKCGNGFCEENHLSCPQDCPIEDGFCETSECDPDCPSQENCVIARKIRLYLPILLIVVSLIVILLVLWRAKKK